MNATHNAQIRRNAPASTDAWTRLKSEFVTLALALARPGRLASQVERMRELQVQAGKIEASHPARAAELNRAASRCLQD